MFRKFKSIWILVSCILCAVWQKGVECISVVFRDLYAKVIVCVSATNYIYSTKAAKATFAFEIRKNV